ncbi:MAG TPA: peptidyl-prolyl cis-trans isomerase [Anaeromyxobacteraceae bacterium]|nr:peptidyl-prolyl cis-trans isomerase [Anaeromyxobacteraceae bacterium]
MRTMRARAKWIMGVVAVLFVGWMIYGYGMDITGRGATATTVVARVNGRSIDANLFYTAVRNEQERRRQQGLPLPTTLEEQRQLEDAVLEQLVQDIILRDELRRRDITVTDREIIQAARTSPPPEVMQAEQFQTEGQFDPQKYQRFIASSADPSFLLALEARYRDELPRLKLFEQITAGVILSDAALWREFRDRNDSVTAAVLQLAPQTAVPDSAAAVTEAEVEEYYRSHRDELERPALAHLSFVAVSRRPTAADSAAALERAQAVHRELLGGADFADVAKRESADSASRPNGGDLGEVPKGSFDPEFEQAALALRPGQLSAPVATQFGYHLIRLESRTDSTLHAHHILIPIEPVGEHLTTIEAQADTLDLFAAEQTTPGALDDVAQRLGLPVAQAPPVLEGDRLQLGRFLISDAGIWAFSGARAGETSPVIETEFAYYVFRLDSLFPAGVPPLESIREDVARLAEIEKRRVALRRLADEIAARVQAGETLEAIAAARGLTVRVMGPFTRYQPPIPLQPAPAAVGAAFGLRVGQTGGPVVTPNATFFLRPLRKVLADSSAFAQQLETLRAQSYRRARQEQVELVLASLRDQATVRDLRRDVERAQRQAQSNAPQQPPTGF